MMFDLKGVASFGIKLLLTATLFSVAVLPHSLWGQYGSVEIAKTYIIANDNTLVGDIVAFNRETQQYELALNASNRDIFGVVVEDPVLVLETGSGGLPVVRTGEVIVNATLENGPIGAGDYLAASNIPGKSRRAREEDAYVIGIALEPSVDVADNALEAGSATTQPIRTLLSIGTREAAQALLDQKENKPVDTGLTEATVLNIIQYLLAAFISVGSIFIAFKNFGPNIKDGVVSIGRNPLARSSIQSIVILNAVLIILVSAGGLFVGVAILFLPI